MKLPEIAQKLDQKGWVIWKNDAFCIQVKRPASQQHNRETLARVYEACVAEVQGASQFVRSLWKKEYVSSKHRALPRIIAEDGFLRQFALGEPLSCALFISIWKQLDTYNRETTYPFNPIDIGWNLKSRFFYDEDATPPGVLAKLSIIRRLRVDKIQLDHVRQDLKLLASIENAHKRQWLTLAILSHGAAYREIEGKVLEIPCFKHSGKLISYKCRKHLIAEGVRTISMTPLDQSVTPIYLCQGTELWPSQPSMLGSILSNFALHGSATGAYAHSWRRIHKHLRDLHNGRAPIVVGHSMGGSLAMQIGLYSHDLIEKVYAYNPPMPNKRDYAFYHQMDPKLQEKICVTANLDDFAFWRIGAKVIGNVTLFLGKKRWKYYPVSFLDCIFVMPAFMKFILNVRHAFPAHQNIVALSENWISLSLSQKEIEIENADRLSRFDYLHFFPKLYDPMKMLFCFVRKAFGWGMEAQFLRNEIEIIALHERDLIDTITEENQEEIEKELSELHRQKELLQKQLFKNQ